MASISSARTTRSRSPREAQEVDAKVDTKVDAKVDAKVEQKKSKADNFRSQFDRRAGNATPIVDSRPKTGGVLAGLLGVNGPDALHKQFESDPEKLRTTRANKALKQLEAPAADHPYSVHVANVRKALEAQGLPSSAEGVRVHVVDGDPHHGGAVARTVSGPVGIAPGADLKLDFGRSFEKIGLSRAEIDRVNQRLWVNGGMSVEGVTELGMVQLERLVHQKRADLAHIVGSIPEGHDQTTIANFSYGQSPARLANSITADVVAGTKTQTLTSRATGRRATRQTRERAEP